MCDGDGIVSTNIHGKVYINVPFYVFNLNYSILVHRLTLGVCIVFSLPPEYTGFYSYRRLSAVYLLK